MNKLKQLYKAFLSKWNDGTLYKTSLTKKSTLFKYRVLLFAGTIGAFILLCLGGELPRSLSYLVIMLCFNLALIMTHIYKGVADNVLDEE